MKVEFGDIWDRFEKSFIVVPTNIGWKKPSKAGKPGANVMGTGMALEAANHVPNLPTLYGEYCHRFGASTEVTFDLSSALVLFPTKSLDQNNPGMSWKQKSTPDLIEKSAKELAALSDLLTREAVSKNSDSPTMLEDDEVYLPLVGCGAGGLPEKEVLPILSRYLSNKFHVVKYQPF